MFTDEALVAMRQHAIDEYPRESCGVVVNDVYYPCKNVHKDPEKSFRIDPRTYAKFARMGDIQAIIHSHPDGPFFPSKADMEGQIATDVPWGIIYSAHDSASRPLMWGDGVEKAPLIGRMFIHGIQDCYSLIRDYYQMELGIELMEAPREDNWWENDENMYLDNFVRAGFERVMDLQPHDVILMNIRSPVPNHGAVYTGGDTILHHLAGRTSDMEEGGVMRWHKFIQGYYRHKDIATALASKESRNS